MSKKFKVLNRTVTKVKVKMCVKNERKEGKTDSPQSDKVKYGKKSERPTN